MSATTLTCRCRFCGYLICYARENIGADSQCPGCSQTVRLPGKLAAVALIQRVRRNSGQSLVLELAGFALMFLYFPWGLLAGCPVVYLGWRKANRLICSQCSSAVASARTESCPACRSRFGLE